MIDAPGPWGTGPFILTEGYSRITERTDEVVLEPNPTYWNPDRKPTVRVVYDNKIDKKEAIESVANGDGRVDVWNLANDSELPTASTHIEPVTMADSSKMVQPSLNKLIWTPNGNQIVVGDDVGRIHVYDIGEVGDLNSSHSQQEDKWQLGEHIA